MLTNLFALIVKAFTRLKTAAMTPFRRVIRQIQKLFNVNLITAKLIVPINKKIREIISMKAKKPEDYVTIGIFWVSKKLLYFLILAICAGVFIYFTIFAEPVKDTVVTSSVVTTTYFDYDDLKLAEFSGKANIRAANNTVVYTGDISAGICTGEGTLWNQSGVLIYKGTFENNKFKGQGTLYYPDGKIQYKGEFEGNKFSGLGTLYNVDGIITYVGEFENGNCSGAGIQYNEKSVMVYEGSFQEGSFHGEGIRYYDNGIKAYEGEFYRGKAQGVGTSYSKAGKELFTGQFARDKIHYETLLDASMTDILEMFAEEPQVYYTKGETCFSFSGTGVALKTNCVVQVQKEETATSGGDGWYLPGDENTELLQETEDDTVSVEFPSDTALTNDTTTTTTTTTVDADGNEVTTTAESVAKVEDPDKDENIAQLPIIDGGNKYSAYYYLDSDEWVKEADLDYSTLKVVGVGYSDVSATVDFLKEVPYVPSNGETNLIDCLSIAKIRLAEPTAFSNISFEQTTKSKAYIQIAGINLAEAIYVETYEIDKVRYRLCHENDNYKEVKFITLETY